MIEALINSLTKLLERNGGGVILNLKHINCQQIEGEQDEWLDFNEAMSGNSNPDDNAHIVNISVSEIYEVYFRLKRCRIVVSIAATVF